MTKPTLIVTRPQPEAGHWVQLLARHGVAAQALPLIDIGPASNPVDKLAAEQARTQWQRYGAIMLVSANAARFFFNKNMPLAPDHQAPAAIKTRVWSPGPGTAHIAQQLGVPAQLIDQPAPDAAQFDSEALWAQVATQVPAMAQARQSVLIVRGASDHTADGTSPSAGGQGRGWLAQQLRAAGVAVEFVAVYERRSPQWTPTFYAKAQQHLQDGSTWLFSSSEAVMHLRNKFTPDQLAFSTAIATHQRIAQAAQNAGFIHVKQCRPSVEEVVASLESTL
ncbi:MAG: uroporphyrinogen-III synthase [Comamonas sp.]